MAAAFYNSIVRTRPLPFFAAVLAGVMAVVWLVDFPSRLAPPQADEKPVSQPVFVAAPLSAAGSAKAEHFPLPSATASDEELLQLARSRLEHSSPPTLLAWAQSPTDAGLRQRLLAAVLHAWGEIDASAAVDWALMQDESCREKFMSAALAGAVRQPEVALRIVRDLLARDADSGNVYGTFVIRAFCAAGNYPMALQLLAAAPADARMDWAKVLFQDWTQANPADAMTALETLADAQLRQDVFQSSVAAWSARAPATLAAYAVSMPAGEERSRTLVKALDNWSLQDPAGLAAWLNTLPGGGDFDAGVALMLSKTDGANCSPETEIQWVENMTSPALKQYSLAKVLQEWRQTAPEAAQQYVANAAWLDETQRQDLLKTFAP
jgi:hypothetical protein